MKKTIITRTALLAAVAVLATSQAMATLTISLDQGNAALSGYPAPFGTISVTRLSDSTAQIVLTAASGPTYSYSFSDGGMVGLNLKGTGDFHLDSIISGTTIPGGNVFNAANYVEGGAGNEDGFGSFNFTLNNGGNAFKDSVTSLKFNISTDSGGWTSDAAVLAQNGSGYNVAGHIFVRNTSDNSNTDVTGFAVVPEPTTMVAGALLLLPFGASTLRILRKRRTA